MKNKGKEAAKPLRFLQKIEKPIPRPPTPSVEVPDLVDEEKELAIIFLQQVIRGRAIQNMVSSSTIGSKLPKNLIISKNQLHKAQNT